MNSLSYAVIFLVLFLWYFQPFQIAEVNDELAPNLGSAKMFKDERTCLQILKGDRCGDGVNRHSALFSRAIANSRLIGAFGIDNAFTTTDQEWKTNFTKLAARLLQVAPNRSRYGWEQIRQKADLRMTFAIFFHIDPKTVSYQTAKGIANEINKLWLVSKCSTNIPKWTDQTDLHKLLESVVPSKSPLDQVHNPMNIILPAYETLWRVVLRCFIEIIDEERCGKQNSAAWRAVLKRFLKDPSQQQPRKSTNPPCLPHV